MAVSFIQVIGIVVPNLVPELLKTAEFLTPQIIAHMSRGAKENRMARIMLSAAAAYPT